MPEGEDSTGSRIQAAEETGWDRVKSLMSFRPGDDLPSELKELSLTIFIASLTGFLFGGMMGARHAGDKFIALNHSSKFTSTMQAQRELHGAALLGFVRKGSLWGWRVGLFAGLFSGSTLLMSVYRDKQDAANYVVAGAATGGLFRISRGIKPFIGGTVLGTLLSVPIGLTLHGLDWLLVSVEEREKVQRSKIESRQKRKENWESKLNATTILIDDIGHPGNRNGLQSYYKLGTDADSSNTSVEQSKPTPGEKT